MRRSSKTTGWVWTLALACVAWIGPATAAAAQSTNGTFEPLRADGNGIEAMRRPVHVDVRDATIADVVRRIMQEARLDLVFSDDLRGLDRRITMRLDSVPAAAALLRVLHGSGLEVRVSPRGQAVLVQATQAAQETGAGSVNGRVIDPAAGGIAEAELYLDGTRRRATTDRHGYFELRDVPPGRYVLTAQRFGYQPAHDSVTVSARAAAEVTLALQPAPAPIAAVVVSPGVFGVMQETLAQRQTLTRAEIETQPQLGDDVFRSVARLPGVSSIDISAAFGVRGGTNDEVLIRLDGLELIDPYHLRDLDDAISIVDIDAVGGVDLITGGFDARYGNRLSAVFDMRSTSVAPGPPRTTVGLSLTSMRAASRGSFADDRGRWLLSARRGYIDLALSLGGSDDEFSPTFYDVLGKVEYAFGSRARLAAHLLYARDIFSQHDTESDDPQLDSDYDNRYGWLTFDANLTDRLSSQTVVAAGGVDSERIGVREREPFLGAIDVADRQDYAFRSIRQEFAWEATDRLLTRWGFDLRTQEASYDYFGTGETWTVENDTRFIVTDTTLVRAQPDGNSAAVWLSQRLRPWDPFTLEIGARWDRHSHTDDEHVSPRIAAALQLGPRTTVRAAWGRYVQAQGLHELEARDGVTTFSAAERAEHRVAGIDHRFDNDVRVRVEAYDIDLPDLRPRTINLNGTLEFFPELTTVRRRIDPTEGYSRGIEVMVNRRAMRGLDWSVAYALAKSEARVDGEWRPRPRDQRHTFGIDFAYRAGEHWRFAAAWQYHSGWPNTPATLRADTAGEDVYYTREYGDYNTGRLGPYHRLDIRVSRHVTTRRGRFLFFLDLFNVYGRDNPRAEYPFPAFESGRIVAVNAVDTLLPRLPSFGVTWEF